MNQNAVFPPDDLSAIDALRLLDGLGAELAPANIEERLTADLRQLIAGVLKIEAEEFSPTRAFMDYGLDSIASTEIGVLFNERFDIKVPPTVFFEFQDLRRFVAYLINNHGAALREFYGDTANSTSRAAIARTSEPDAPIADPAPPEGVPATPDSESPAGIEAMWQIHQQSVSAAAGPSPEQEPAPEPEPAAIGEPSQALLDAQQKVAARAQRVQIERPGAPRLEYAIYGEGSPVLLLGGLVMQYDVMWRLQLEPLGRHHRLIMFHPAGCGGAELYDELSLDSLAKDIAVVLDHAQVDEPVPVIGYSFGGVLAQAFALAHPQRCAGLCIAVSSPSSEGATEFPALMRELQKSARFMALNRDWNMAALPHYQRVIDQFDLRPRLHEIRCPCRIICASDDAYQPPAYSRQIADELPNAELIEMPGAGHLLGFTHHKDYNALLLDFLQGLPRPVNSRETARSSRFMPATAQTLDTLAVYVALGEQGHCAILSAPSAQSAVLLDSLCNQGRSQPVSYRSYFMTSLEEALDASLRLARHHARNHRPDARGQLLLIDNSGYWQGYFDPLGDGAADALVPGVHVVDSLAAARRHLEQYAELPAAVVVIEAGDVSPAACDALIRQLRDLGVLSIVVEQGEREDWLPQRLREAADLIVFGECISGFQAPVGACMVSERFDNPWLMTPNESYVRHVMTNFGLPLRLTFEHLLQRQAGSLPPELLSRLHRIAASHEATYAAHMQHGNGGYAKVARMHGFDARFHEGRGLRSRLVRDGEASREIVDCFVNVGTCARGLNPPDVIAAIARRHDPQHDYWQALRQHLAHATGLPHAIPASSNVTAVEAALTLGLLAAAPQRRKLLCFTGGLGFSMLSAASSSDPEFDIFRQPFQPLYPHSLFIDPQQEDADARLEEALLSGEVAMVWFETIQVDANASRPLPERLIALVEQHRERGGYLVGIDETQTNLMTGSLLHSQALLATPDIVALGSALCDSLLPMGVVLCSKQVRQRAYLRQPSRLENLETRSLSQLSAHIALNCLEDIEREDLLEQARTQGEYFREQLEELRQAFPLIREIRAAGLLLTVELDLDNEPPFVQRSFGYLMWGSMLRDPMGGVAAAVCPIYNNCLRYLPPLTVSRDDIDLMIANLRRALQLGVAGILRDCAAHNRHLGDVRTAGFLENQIGQQKGREDVSEEFPEKDLKTRPRRGTPLPPLDGKGPLVCIIGAGVGGLSMAKQLKQRGIAFDCFEKRAKIGGIWGFDESGEHTSVWSSMNMNTPKGLYQFSDFPMPAHYPDFPSHRQVFDYLDSYVEHFGLRDSIHLDCAVDDAERLPGGGWRVTIASGEVRNYDAMIVANGHHNTPNLPDYAEQNTTIPSIHSKYYRYRHDYRDKRVLVVGVGNSGAQIAVDVSHDAQISYLSLRRGVYVLPHYLFGIRIDKAMGFLNDWWVKKLLPYPLTGLTFTGLYNLLIAKRKQLGMPKPDHLMMSSLPTLSENFANRVGDGKLKIVPQVRSIEGNTVYFVDDSQLEVDAIIYSTGYQTDLPFLDEELLQITDNRIPLFQRIFLPEVNDLAFIGLFQAVTWGFLDMMERQAILVADYLTGQYQRPSAEEERRHIAREHKVIEREFLPTLRNNYEMHGPTYMHGLRKELAQGKARARNAGHTRPVQPKVWQWNQDDKAPDGSRPHLQHAAEARV
ncbi:aminotransferase class III-fold pyridoxal phosphate-dependent enzyme [Pseudochelatococcus contaminans]|uniref:Trimethylamine monooxygenase n=1 Tax=Pseudochelatococcus contaminans TaxID=1538103 RepID=A0A7W5Z6X5_9HYPH|nr:aminotransferase class III-fold pyridoxal phosphate-dependent enzyme [Pseudochelatococcus contaminans]MBB3811109.1 acetylornithine/succinyldiaminopimelate/putrescine aminotransferase/pimeloyl-ACP methyl ester carboxylesterase/acyl carrier protein [Pseudochelatococcus contaminans]